MPRPWFSCVVLHAVGASLIVGGWTLEPRGRVARADEPEDDAEKQEAQSRKERYTNWMRTYAEGTKIILPGIDEDDEQLAEMVPHPVFRYSDEQQAIPDATLWVWTRDARPVAFQKVEGNDQGSAKWTICFASLSEGLIKVHWPGGREYAARKPGVSFKPLPRAEAPLATARARTAQLKALKERFSGRLSVNGDGTGGAETRTIAKPLYEYLDPESKLPVGAIFGMTSTGTNPDMLILIETRRDGDGKLRWEYALARMTANSVRVRLDNEEILAEDYVATNAFESWTFYFLRRDFR